MKPRPAGIEHGYRIRRDPEVRLLAVTSAPREDAEGGWGGLVGDFEAQGELRATPTGIGRRFTGSRRPFR